MVAGVAPFAGEEVRDLLNAVVNSQPPRPSRLNPAVPEMLDLIIAKAMQKDVAARYQSAGEFAADLRSCREAIIDGDVKRGGPGEATAVIAIDTRATAVTATAPPIDATKGKKSAKHVNAAKPNSADAKTVVLTSERVAAPPPGQMWLSRRLSSVKALARLSQPNADDIARLSTLPVPTARVMNWLRGPRNLLLTGMYVTAAVATIVVALN